MRKLRGLVDLDGEPMMSLDDLDLIEDEARIIAQTRTRNSGGGRWFVLTVDALLNYRSADPGPPRVWETMVFYEAADGMQWSLRCRYLSRNLVEFGHACAVPLANEYIADKAWFNRRWLIRLCAEGLGA